jgi:hypothetical protein
LDCGTHLSDQAGAIEAKHQGPSRFDVEHRSYVLSSIIAAASFLEAMINELYQDAHDSHNVSGDGYVAPLTEDVRQKMGELWRRTDFGVRLRTLDKYQLLLSLGERSPLDEGKQPYQDGNLVVQLRNAVLHFRPEYLSADESHTMEKRLRGKFLDNRLMGGSGNPWWPDHCLGHGCSEWAWCAALNLSESVCDSLGIRPNYRQHRESGWFGKTLTEPQ